MAPGARVGYCRCSAEHPVSRDYELRPRPERNAPQPLGRAVSEAPARSSVFQATHLRPAGVRHAHLNMLARPRTATRSSASSSSPPSEAVTDSGVAARASTRSPLARFSQLLGLIDQLFHTVASPPVAYLLLLTRSGAARLRVLHRRRWGGWRASELLHFLAFSGLAVLPTRTWAVAVIGLAMLAFSIDVQVGIPDSGPGRPRAHRDRHLVPLRTVAGASMRPRWISLITGLGGHRSPSSSACPTWSAPASPRRPSAASG